MVRLFNFPVVWDDAPYKAFRGHSSHVMCIRFACDDRMVISAGGHDRGLYQVLKAGGATHLNATNEPSNRFVPTSRYEPTKHLPNSMPPWIVLDYDCEKLITRSEPHEN